MPGDGGFSVDEVDDAQAFSNPRNGSTSANLPPATRSRWGARSSASSAKAATPPNAYRGLKHYLALRAWDQNKIQAMIGGLEFMHNGVMPPFAGTDSERAALAAYLSTIHPISAAAPAATDGETVFEQNCSMCHQVHASDKLFRNLPKDPNAASDALKDLTSLFPLMPDLKLSDQQRAALAQWVNAQRGAKGITVAPQGGN